MLSPSLQSYLNANDPSWVGGTGDGGNGGGSSWLYSTQRQRDPTAIYREEIARIGRRFGFNNRASGGGNSRLTSRSVDRRSARSAALLYHQRGGALPYTRLGRDGTLVQEGESSTRKRQGVVPRRSYKVEGFLEQGLDGGVALTGRMSGCRSIGRGPQSTENSRYDVRARKA